MSPTLPPELTQALANATRQWHEATRHYEMVSRAFADAQTQLQTAERDLHELARAIEVVALGPVAAGDLTSNQATPAGSVTMPVVPGGGSIGPSADGLDAGQVVLEHMMQQRMGMP